MDPSAPTNRYMMQTLKKLSRNCSAFLFALLLWGCGGEGQSTDTQDSSSDGSQEPDDDTPVDEEKSHYPLLAGASWEYQVVDVNGVELRKEIVEATKDPDAKDGVQIILTDNEDSEGERTKSKIRRIGQGAFRVHKDILVSGEIAESVDYDPGFVRFDEAWTKLSKGESRDYSYERSTSLEKGKEEQRGHRYTVKGKEVKIKVPAGVFTCVHISRERLTGASAGEIVEYWFAPGVGKVREKRLATGKEELLIRFTPPSKAR